MCNITATKLNSRANSGMELKSAGNHTIELNKTNASVAQARCFVSIKLAIGGKERVSSIMASS